MSRPEWPEWIPDDWSWRIEPDQDCDFCGLDGTGRAVNFAKRIDADDWLAFAWCDFPACEAKAKAAICGGDDENS